MCFLGRGQEGPPGGTRKPGSVNKGLYEIGIEGVGLGDLWEFQVEMAAFEDCQILATF